jgi:ABC-type Fe3+-hydroxamate transport system substrate-binding protein
MAADALDAEHAPAPHARIVSLVPSITETLIDLGLHAQIAGRTGFCIHPRERVAGIPKVGGTKDVNVERVRQLAPTHVIVNIDENDKPVVDALRAFVPHVIVTHPNAPVDNLALFRLLGAVFCREEAAEQLCRCLREELAACRRVGWKRERVLYLIWKNPWISVACDTYIAGALACVGWQVLHGAGGAQGAARYPVVDLGGEVGGADRVLLSTEPYRFGEGNAAELRGQFPGKPVALIDGEMTSWYGSRAIRGLSYLREIRGAIAL